MRRVYLIILLLSVLAMLVVTGCATSPQPTQSPLQQPDAATASPLATPTAEVQPPALKVETPGTATVGGRLLRLNNTPIKNSTVYVAAVDEATGTKLASIDPVVAPRAETDADGRFVFNGLTPGEYALVMSTPNGLVLPETAAGKSVVFTAQADQVNDLGSVSIAYEYLDN
jgi:protocatechuate 3,4-dioxygenase beta subunit